MNVLDKKNIEDIFALTPMQEGMLFHYLKAPESGYYFEQLCLEISGEIDVKTFEKAWKFIIETNEMLRAVFRWEKVENPIQVILKEHQLQPKYYDFSGGRAFEKEKQLREIKNKDREEKFDLREVPFKVTLCKIEEDKYEMIISNHHILYDGWSNGIILIEFFEAYTNLSLGKELVKPVKTKFKEFVKWIHHLDREKQEKFWQEYLKGFDTQPGLSIKRQGKKGKEAAGTGNYGIHFGEELKRELGRFIKEHKITMASLLYTAWGLLLQRYNNSRDVIFGTTVSGRAAKVQGIEKIVGLFINTVPLRLQAHSNEKVEHLLQRTEYALKTREAYDTTPLVNIKEYSGLDNSEVFFDSIVVIENYPLETRLMRENSSLPFSIGSYSMIEKTHYDLTVIITLFDEIEVKFGYRRELFDEEIIMRLSGHLGAILQNLVRYPGKPISGIDILFEEERHKILYEFNSTRAGYPEEKTLHQLFTEQLEKKPDIIAVITRSPVSDSIEPNKHLTYNQLNRASDQLAHLLKKKGIGPDTIVGIMMERSVGMVVGILGILKAGGAYLPIDPAYPAERIRYILKDSGAKVLLVAPETQVNVKERFIEIIDIIKLLSSSTLTSTSTCQVSHTNLAYVIYTSGSTGNPKGVMVEHRAAVNVVSALQEKYPFRKSDTYLLKTAYIFDVSVTELFGWFLGGGRLAVLEKEREKDPYKILNAIEDFGVTHINFVPSMFNFFIRVLDPHNISKLASLRYIFLAGEALLPGVVNRFRNLNTTIVLENLYGPTEGTVYASGYSLSQSETGNRDIVPIGKPLVNIRLYILDQDDHCQPIGVPGELCIGGVGLARGYLNKPELTAEKFDHDLWDYQNYHDKKNKSFCGGFQMLHGAVFSKSAPLVAEGKIYRTGDLARWLVCGNIEFLGRIDHQVKVRGLRIELGEIESHLLTHEAIKEAVVVAKESETGSNYLCAYFVTVEVSERTPNRTAAKPKGIYVSELRKYLSNTLPDYMIPTYFVRLERLPLTPSGKVDRKALPEPEIGEIEDIGTYVAPRDKVEEKLAQIWCEVLEIEKEMISIDSNFFELGGHSLKVIGLVGRINKTFNIQLPISEIFSMPTIRELAAYINKTDKTLYLSIKPVEEKEYYDVSSAQKWLFVHQQNEPQNIIYNITGMVSLEGKVHNDKFEQAFKKIISRHQSLRTSFEIVEWEPVQIIHDEVDFEIEFYYLGKEANRQRGIEESIINDFIRPFDLSQAPLIRVGLIKLEKQAFILIVDMHHIISDGISMVILVKEFMSLYEGKDLPELLLQYRDFSEWQRHFHKSDPFRKQGLYWLDRFKGDLPELNLPTDYPRPPVQSFEGQTITFELEKELSQTLVQTAKQRETTLYILLLAAFNILLFKYTQSNEMVIGVPSAGRNQKELEGVVGMFVNTLAIRNTLKNDCSFKDFLNEVKENALQAYENQDYPLEELVNKLKIPRDMSRNPIFDILFVSENIGIPELKVEDLMIAPYEFKSKRSHMDLVVYIDDVGDGVKMSMEYATALFKPSTVKKMIQHYSEILEQVAENICIKLVDITISRDSADLVSTIPQQDYMNFGF